LVLQYVAEDMIRADGLSDFRYVDTQAGLTSTALLARGEVGFVVAFWTALAIRVCQGEPIKVLSGVHVGCYELFAHDGINSVLKLKGRSVGVGDDLGSDPHVLVSAMATHVGLNPPKDIHWVTSDVEPMELFA
jgi:NitT/TauT family transport system substrate-binding protein